MTNQKWANRNAQIKRIMGGWRNAGATHIKIELEANTGLNIDSDDCYDCDGGGELWNSYEEEYEICGNCDGDGYTYGDDGEALEEALKYQFPFITYIKVYNDGSVDTEATITVPIIRATRLPDIIEAFKQEVGNYDTTNAGMHISALWGGRYPSREYQHPQDKKDNFKRNVKMLLPAMYLLASNGNTTRGLGYRGPSIGEHSKSVAVNFVANAIEFRIFDPCYEQPERVLDHLEVMANALKFYANPNLKVNDRRFPSKCNLGTTGRIKALVNGSLEAVRATNAGLGYLKPKHITNKQLFAQYGLFESVQEARGKTPLDTQGLEYNRFDYYQAELKRI